MSKWCGDENCLQCADKEPDPYVHLPRADYEALREQNRVLLKALRVAVFLDGPDTVQPEFERWSLLVDEGLKQNFNEWYGVQVLAALTATSQPERRCPDCQSPYAQCQAWRAQGKIACCPDCRHDATSQEGQHGSRT